MFKSLLFAAAIAVGVTAIHVPGHAATLKGRCMVTATVHGGKKFALLKCDRADFPGDFIIRRQVWEHKDRKDYKRLARFAGRRFACDITYDKTTRRGMIESNIYSLKNCR